VKAKQDVISVTKSFDFDQLKTRSAELSKSWKKKLGYLSESVSRDGLGGASHWLKSHHQIEAFEEAINELTVASESDEFALLQVETTLSSFVLPEEDRAQAEWYGAAHRLLLQFEKSLVEEHYFDAKLLQSILNELKFISQSNEFHHQYRLQSIQEKVTKMYQALQQSLADYKTIEKEKLAQKAEEDKLKLAQVENEKAQAEAKKKMMESVKIKEKRLAIIEEKKRLLAVKEIAEKNIEQEQQQAEIQAKQAEVNRQAKLQEAYVDLQLEEKVANWEISEFIDKFNKRLNNVSLDENQKQLLAAFSEAIRAKS